VHNYSEGVRYNKSGSRSSASSSRSESTIHSEDESFEKKASKNKPERTSSKRIPKPPQREAVPTRSSGRIQAANIETTKRLNYNEDDTDTE
jgi:hypothetical protein